MECQRCDSERVVMVNGKTSDMCQVAIFPYIEGIGEWAAESNGYVPPGMGITESDDSGDYINFHYCLDCGQMQGHWPKPRTRLDRQAFTPAKMPLKVVEEQRLGVYTDKKRLFYFLVDAQGDAIVKLRARAFLASRHFPRTEYETKKAANAACEILNLIAREAKSREGSLFNARIADILSAADRAEQEKRYKAHFDERASKKSRKQATERATAIQLKRAADHSDEAAG